MEAPDLVAALACGSAFDSSDPAKALELLSDLKQGKRENGALAQNATTMCLFFLQLQVGKRDAANSFCAQLLA